jgi:DNA-directed RNA polymerase specialized sigma24 family protein
LIFQLRHFEGLTLEEIQRSLGLDISPVGIGSILNRITSRLRERLKR